MTCWELLANAIVERAAEDYIRGKIEYFDDARMFFFTQWFGTLTTVDPYEFVRRLDELKSQKKIRRKYCFMAKNNRDADLVRK